MATSARRREARPSRARGTVLVLALLPEVASALDVTLQLAPAFSYTRDRTTGAVSSDSESWFLDQKYRLSLGQDLLTRLRLDANGYLDSGTGWTRANGAWTDTGRQLWNGDLRLAFGGQPLGGAGYYTYQRSDSETTSAGVTLSVPALVRESTGFTLGWTPASLPRLNLLWDRSHLADVSRQAQDTVTDSVLVSADYQPARPVSLRYSLGSTTGENRLSGVTSDTLTQNAQVSWGDSFWQRRLTAAASYQAQSTVLEARAGGGTGSTQLPQVPQAGLSVVEPTTSLPDQIKLQNTPALVDGNLTAGAGVDIGWGGSQTGNPRPREIGAQFADPLTEVELLYVWVDRRLPPDVAGAFQWTAWRSDDGEHWTSVAASGPVKFGALDNRFEIPVAPARAPYLKVVVKPLPLGVTTDQQYLTILVTEIQLFRESAVPAGGLRQTTFGGMGTASARLLLLPGWNLTGDLSGSLTHRSNRAGVDWSLTDGLSASRRLSAILEGRARLEHAMGRIGLLSGEVTQNDLRLTAGLDASFLPTLRAAASYQGQIAFQGGALSRSYNAILVSASAQPYRGFSISGDGTYTAGEDGATHGTFDNAGANLSVNLVPNRFVTVSGGGGFGSVSSTSATGTRSTRTGQLTASVALTPLTSLYGSGTVTRYAWAATPRTVFTLAANFSPFPGGQLLLNFSYNDNLNVTDDTRTTLWGPSLRWTIRPATFLTASYSQLRGRYPTYQTRSDGVFVTLTITL